MTRPYPPRPLSPHLSDGARLHWRWGPHMFVSILHRVSGAILSLAGLPIMIWWLGAVVGGQGAYRVFAAAANSPAGIAVLVVVSWAFFMHLLSGLRHFVLDTGAGYELRANKGWALAVLVLAPVLTAAFWALVLFI
ncbi:MAG TPA: succinate dehydrogenase, cytochrome b556 subunit [Novosphingobium sp.]|nr:succinate dehydrogenase, cytochrome b556 subunit [Novosphingobium sp.]